LTRGKVRWVLFATLVEESAWLFSAIAVFGVATEIYGGALAWPVVMAVMGISLTIVHLSRLEGVWVSRAYRYRALIGVAVLYGAVASQLATTAFGLDLLWPARVFVGGHPQVYSASAAVGVVAGALLWWRGGALASAESLSESLIFSMRLGVFVLAFAGLVDIVLPVDLHSFSMAFIFFAAGLAGLSIHRMSINASRTARRGGWSSIMFGPVSAVVLIGVLFSLVQRGALSRVSDPALSALRTVAEGVLWVILIPIAFVVDLAIQGILKFFDRPFSPELTNQTEITVEEVRQGIDQLAQEEAELAEEGVRTASSLLLQAIEWSVLIGIALIVGTIVLMLFLRAYRRGSHGAAAREQGDRESVRVGTDLASDLGRMLSKLVPGWLGRSGEAHTFALPDGHPGVVEALRIYYQMVTMAERRGFRRRAHETASEFQATLETVFPRDLVRMATAAFNRAFYGNHPELKERIDQMRTSLASKRGQAG
jgi:hypothetical protein